MTFLFQIVDITYRDELIDNDESSFVIEIFGKTKDGKTIYLKVLEYEPYFYINIEKPEYSSNIIDYYLYEIKLGKNGKPNKNSIFKSYSKNNVSIEKLKSFTEFKNNETDTFIKFKFKNIHMMNTMRYFIDKNKNPYCNCSFYQTGNTDPIIHYIYDKMGEPTGWIEIDESNIENINDDDILCDYKYSIHHNDVNFVNSNDVINYKILSFDLECDSKDGSFPIPERDSIIQIGMVLSTSYKPNDFTKVILCLNDTDHLNNINVISFPNEKAMLLYFKEIILMYDPDILIGYNIFGFDYKYLNKRTEYLQIESDFNQFSKIKSRNCMYKEKILESNAYGKNNLYYYEIPGRISIDLYKTIQRDYKLPSYKLDSVSAYFIKDTIINIKNNDNNTCCITTKSTFGLEISNYITITYYDGILEDKYNNNQKYKIIDIESNTIIINDVLDNNLLSYKKIYWCSAKDDISAKDIFAKFKINSFERSIIAKYCIQDCILCNQLFDKLKILNNNLSLARVCHVPLSYLFFRGQGIKLLSLVLRKTKEKNFLIKKNIFNNTQINTEQNINDFYYLNNDQIIQEPPKNDSYEGAIVFKPDPKIYYVPVIVLDYGSLYPSSMILRNTSHECIIKNNKYLDHPHNNIVIDNEEYKFIINNHKGIIPDCLNELLTNRKKYKKMMENEKDPFVKSLLDCLQLAYKITANSLYGITGTPSSDLFMKEIAASTTSTGREMLLCAKWFVENKLTTLINLALTNKTEYINYFNELFTYHPHNIPFTHEDKDYVLLISNFDNILIDNKKFCRTNINYYDSPKYDNTIDISMLNINEQYDLYKLLYNYIINKKGTRKHIYELYAEFFDKNKTGDIKNLDNEFLTNFKHTIDDVGFKNKSDLCDKFFHVCNDLFVNSNSINLQVIYGDTDSIFFITNYKIDNEIDLIQLSIKIGIWASILINIILPEPMILQYEKVLYPFIIQGKKRYVGNLYELSPTHYYTKIMGIELKRRDNAPIVKKILAGLIDILLNKKDVNQAFAYIQSCLKNIINDNYPLEDYIITKSIKGDALTPEELEILNKQNKTKTLLTEDENIDNIVINNCYKSRTNLPHVALADKMAERDRGNKPSSNDRIEYAYIIPNILSKRKKLKQSEKIETPQYIKDNNLLLDKYHYINNQIKNPVLNFLNLFSTNGNDIFDYYLNLIYNISNNITTLDQY